MLSKKERKEINKDVGRWAMDIGKYIITAGIITSFLGQIEHQWVFYTAGLMIAFSCFSFGLYLSHKKIKQS